MHFFFSLKIILLFFFFFLGDLMLFVVFLFVFPWKCEASGSKRITITRVSKSLLRGKNNFHVGNEKTRKKKTKEEEVNFIAINNQSDRYVMKRKKQRRKKKAKTVGHLYLFIIQTNLSLITVLGIYVMCTPRINIQSPPRLLLNYLNLYMWCFILHEEFVWFRE